MAGARCTRRYAVVLLDYCTSRRPASPQKRPGQHPLSKLLYIGIFHSRYFVTLHKCKKVRHPKGARPFVLLALLLLALPLVLTLQKFVLLPLLGERSHQLLLEPTTFNGC